MLVEAESSGGTHSMTNPNHRETIVVELKDQGNHDAVSVCRSQRSKKKRKKEVHALRTGMGICNVLTAILEYN